ncbi:MAG: hypothetical protein ACYTFW_12225 [Planctomycetota bacterium]|jgi:hypothetical protein
MLAQKKGTATTAPKSKRQRKSYKSSRIKSRVNLKTSLGELLWIVECSGDGKIEAKVWEGLERLLRRYLGIIHSRGSNDGRKTG